MSEALFGKSKEYIKDILDRNPAYDAGWVDAASDILSANPDYNEDYLAKFTAEKLMILKQALESYKADIEFLNLIKPELNVTQLQILMTAKSNNVDNKWLSVLSNPAIAYQKANYIAQGMVNGYNMADIIDITQFDSDQIYEIFAGIESNVDYNKYLDKKYPAEIMGIIRHALQLGLSIDVTNDELIVPLR